MVSRIALATIVIATVTVITCIYNEILISKKSYKDGYLDALNDVMDELGDLESSGVNAIGITTAVNGVIELINDAYMRG